MFDTFRNQINMSNTAREYACDSDYYVRVTSFRIYPHTTTRVDFGELTFSRFTCVCKRSETLSSLDCSRQVVYKEGNGGGRYYPYVAKEQT